MCAIEDSIVFVEANGSGELNLMKRGLMDRTGALTISLSQYVWKHLKKAFEAFQKHRDLRNDLRAERKEAQQKALKLEQGVEQASYLQLEKEESK